MKHGNKKAGTNATAGAGGDETSKELTAMDYYFDSYSHFGIHEEMIKDRVRTQAYRNSILQNPWLFRGKTVLDVGCGTGILSMFCAQAGAKKVYGVECSGIATQAIEIVKENGLEGVVTIIKGKIEEVEVPEKVDIIISEWMGYFLYYESMLESVIYARDKWLAPNGIILPDKATLFISAIEDGEYKEEKIEFWKNVYGFKMSCIRELAIQEPLVDTVEADSIVTDDAIIHELDICSVKEGRASFSSAFTLVAKRDEFIHALVAYFDTSFNACHSPIVLDTSPQAEPTHWKQSVFYLDDAIPMCEGEELNAHISCLPNESNPRDLEICIKYDFAGKRGAFKGTRRYKMR